MQGEVFVRLMISNTNGRKMGLIFHPECYLSWNENKFYQRYKEWKISRDNPRKRGRPRKYKDSKLVNRLKALKKYHEFNDNEEAVMIIDEQIRNQEV
jgi:hypothetical protein